MSRKSTKGSGQNGAKIYAKPLPIMFQRSIASAGVVFHNELRPPAWLVYQGSVQMVLAIEDHILPANRAKVREQRGITAILGGVPVSD
jgi:hypothetical protein